jgi:hypothetical protein
MSTRQVNIRLDAIAADELEAHAFLRRLPAASLARDVIMQFLDDKRDEPGMETARRARVEYEAETGNQQEQAVTPLRIPRRQ